MQEGRAMSKRFDTESAATFLGVAAQTLKNWRVLGIGPEYLKLNGRVVYDEKDLSQWTDARRRQSTAQRQRH
jgi:predicted site-specific integrase-resolvase